MKLKDNSLYFYIEPLDQIWLFKHFFDGETRVENSSWNWKFIELMCAAHNEPFERVR